jgi:hypothetical protein
MRKKRTMNNQEAIKILTKINVGKVTIRESVGIEFSYDKEQINALYMAIEALEKQIPKKPIENERDWAVCKNCGGSISKDNIFEHIVDRDITFCEHCGQAVDWQRSN